MKNSVTAVFIVGLLLLFCILLFLFIQSRSTTVFIPESEILPIYQSNPKFADLEEYAGFIKYDNNVAENFVNFVESIVNYMQYAIILPETLSSNNVEIYNIFRNSRLIVLNNTVSVESVLVGIRELSEDFQYFDGDYKVINSVYLPIRLENFLFYNSKPLTCGSTLLSFKGDSSNLLLSISEEDELKVSYLVTDDLYSLIDTESNLISDFIEVVVDDGILYLVDLLSGEVLAEGSHG